MELKVKRVAKRNTYTIGKFYINNKYFCDTLEDADRGLNQKDSIISILSKKIKGNTAIPTGNYEVIVNKSPRFKRDLPRLISVPGFEGILIHRGNTDKDTSGCILVGENKIVGKVINSTAYEVSLVKRLKEAINKNEKINITIE